MTSRGPFQRQLFHDSVKSTFPQESKPCAYSKIALIIYIYALFQQMFLVKVFKLIFKLSFKSIDGKLMASLQFFSPFCHSLDHLRVVFFYSQLWCIFKFK